MVIKTITVSENTIIIIPKMYRKYRSNNLNNRFVIIFVANLVVQPKSVMCPRGLLHPSKCIYPSW